MLALGVTGDPLAIASELRVVGWQQLKPSHGTLAEFVDRATVTEDAVHLPMGRDRAEIDDLHVTLRGDLLERFGLHRHVAQRSGCHSSATRSPRPASQTP